MNVSIPSLLGLFVFVAGCDASPKPSAPSSAVVSSASVASSSAAPSLGALFGTAARVEIAHGGGARVESNDKANVDAIVAAIGPKQVPAETAMPKCLTPTTIHFFDAAGKKLGSFGSCASEGLAEAGKSAGRVDLPSGDMGGVQVADVGALRSALAALSVTLP